MHTADTWRPATDIGEFVSELGYEVIPARARDVVERAVLDTVGVTLAGVSEGAGRRAIAAMGAPDCGGTESAGVVGTDLRTSAPEAAFLTGTAAHSLDYDDYTYAYPLHPSATIVPPMLALAGHEQVDGRDAIEAYTAGFETLYYLTAPVSPAHYEQGWHATGTFGVFAAAATTASLIDLGPEATRDALRIAASMPAGLQRNFGTDTKPMHAGQAARSGLTAARLSREGFSAERRALTGEGGFYDRYCGPDDIDRDAIPTLGEPLGVVTEGVNTKLYPACGATHSSIAAVATLARTHEFAPADVERIAVEIAPFGKEALRYSTPGTGQEAKFSLEYCVAAALLRDRVGLGAFERAAVTDESIRSLLERVEVSYDESLVYNDHRSAVTVATVDGQQYTETVSHPPGTIANPVTADELERKFRECATRTVSEPIAGTLVRSLRELRTVDSLEKALSGALPAGG
jgi:2-methylcitrate dehydratase PrpD